MKDPRAVQAAPPRVLPIMTRYWVGTAFVVFIFIGSLLLPAFVSAHNLANVLIQIAITGIMALGMTAVVLTGGIDLSVGSVVALVSVLAAGAQGHGVLAVIAAGLAAGAAVGLLNGLGVVYAGIQPFVMTLGTMAVVRGLAFLYSGGVSTPVAIEMLDLIGSGTMAGIPIPGLLFIVLLSGTAFFMARAPAGRHIYAIGSNPDAARLAGVSVSRHLLGAYVFSGVMAAVGGILFVAQQGVGMALAGVGYELNAIAAVVLGGASLAGGEGTMFGTALGAAAIGLLGNMMNLSGMNPFGQDLLKGIVLIIAALLRPTRGRRHVLREGTGVLGARRGELTEHL